jgi:hypothetical protein
VTLSSDRRVKTIPRSLHLKAVSYFLSSMEKIWPSADLPEASKKLYMRFHPFQIGAGMQFAGRCEVRSRELERREGGRHRGTIDRRSSSRLDLMFHFMKPW